LATTRCSRPLCSSQDTGGPATKPAASAAGRHGPRETRLTPVPSGPNSVPAQSLTRRHRSSSPEGKPYWTGTEIRPDRITRCPQMSSHLKTLA